ncbi:hypothetical protein LXL04_008157 [Taraxacum kok-saghyz]
MRKSWCFRQVEAPMTEDQLRAMLKKFDTNGDGKISRKELRVGLRSLGVRFTFFRAISALRHADINGDGVINDDEINVLAKYVSKSLLIDDASSKMFLLNLSNRQLPAIEIGTDIRRTVQVRRLNLSSSPDSSVPSSPGLRWAYSSRTQISLKSIGFVDIDEFGALYKSIMDDRDHEEDVMEAFNVFDQNRDGFITVEELRSVLESLGLKQGRKADEILVCAFFSQTRSHEKLRPSQTCGPSLTSTIRYQTLGPKTESVV